MSLGCHESATATATLSGMPPRETFERLSVWAILRQNSKWNEFSTAVTPVFHRGLTHTWWGPMPIGLGDEARGLHLARLRLFFLVFLKTECAHGERVVADAFRRHLSPPPHLSLADLVALHRDGSWERIVEAIERKPFEQVSVPDVERMDLPAISFVGAKSSALERLCWLGLDPRQYAFDPHPLERSGPRPEMARDRRSKRLAAKAAQSTSTSDGEPEPSSPSSAIVVPMEAFSRYRWKRSRRER